MLTVSNHKGFTLIETLVALLIVGIALGGLISSYTHNTHYLAYAKDKVLAQMLMDNLIVERRQIKQSVGRVSDSIKFGNKTWYWQTITTPFQLDKTLSIQIKLFTSKADRDRKDPIELRRIYVQE